MGFLSSLFGGGKSVSNAVSVARTNLIDDVKHQIEIVEGELHEAREQLSTATDPEIKASFDAVVARKAQAVLDLEEKLESLT